MGICLGTSRIVYRVNPNVMGAVLLKTVHTIKTYLTDGDGNETYIMYIPGDREEIRLITKPNYQIPAFNFTEGFNTMEFSTKKQYRYFVDKIYFMCLMVLERAVLENVRNCTYYVDELEEEYLSRIEEVTLAAQNINIS